MKFESSDFSIEPLVLVCVWELEFACFLCTEIKKTKTKNRKPVKKVHHMIACEHI